MCSVRQRPERSFVPMDHIDQARWFWFRVASSR